MREMITMKVTEIETRIETPAIDRIGLDLDLDLETGEMTDSTSLILTRIPTEMAVMDVSSARSTRTTRTVAVKSSENAAITMKSKDVSTTTMSDVRYGSAGSSKNSLTALGREQKMRTPATAIVTPITPNFKRELPALQSPQAKLSRTQKHLDFEKGIRSFVA